ncbi:MAG: aminodeoxychorismate/anthranilate synthase component II [Chitinophagales bacterium]
MKVLIVDNYDSFTFNLVQLIEQFGKCQWKVVKNDECSLDEVADYDKVLFTPGAGLPSEAPIMYEILQRFEGEKSILGVCLGHQAIAEYYGATLFNFERVIHGIVKPMEILQQGDYLFRGLPNVVEVGLYHSWAVAAEGFPECLEVTAKSTDGVVMALSHRTLDVKGVQFHPESIMTKFGKEMVWNWLG